MMDEAIRALTEVTYTSLLKRISGKEREKYNTLFIS